MRKTITQKVLYVVLGAALSLSVAKVSISQTVRNQAGTLSDEAQAIHAVRGAKASVVTIVGSIGTAQKIDSTFGTGFIVESSGYIVSNNHVVADKNATYTVQLFTGQQFQATVVGIDSYNDIALLKINADKLGTLKLGNSEALETGQSVFAIGNSLGKYQNTVTKGVVSGLGRNISVGTRENPQPRLQNLVQTDAAINPGNSGGPLINMNGEVIGMNTVIDTEGAGLGFAIPSNIIRDTIGQLKTLGKVPRAYMGIGFETLDKNVRFARSLGNTQQGAYVSQVDPNGPSGKAGVKIGDIILSVNGELLSETNELDILVQRKYQAGNQILLKIQRGNQLVDAVVLLGEFK